MCRFLGVWKPFGLLVIWGIIFLGVGYGQVPHFRMEVLPEGFELKQWVMDEEGFIWAGGKGPIYRFDGVSWDAYANPVSESEVSSMEILKGGEIWVGYENGQICHKKDHIFAAYEPEEGLPQVPITGFAKDAKGNFWFSTYGEGLYFHNGRHLYQRSIADGLPDDDIYALIVNDSGHLFAGSDGGLMEISWQQDAFQIKIIDEKKGLPDLIVREIALGKAGQIWLGMDEGGVAAYFPDRDSLVLLAGKKRWEFGPINKLLELNDQLLIGTGSKGLWTWDGSALLPWTQGKRESIEALLDDGAGQLFVQSSTQGLLSASYRFQKIREVETKIQAVCETRNGALYFASADGLFRRNIEGEIDTILYPMSYNIICLSEKNQGELLLGTFGQGIVILDPTTENHRFLTEKEGLVNNNVIAFAKQGDMHWVATLGGVSRCSWGDEGQIQITNFDRKDGLGTNYIYHVFVDSKSHVWLGTDGRGAYVFDGKVFLPVAGLVENNVYSIAEDKEGGIWFATEEQGLYRLFGDSLQHIQLAGLTGLQAAGLLCDAHNRLLITHENGVSLLDVATLQLTSFGEETGMEDFNADLNVMAIGKQGKIWLGSPRGIYLYESDVPLQNAPISRMRGVSVFLEPLAQDPLSLAYDQNNLSFDFAGIWYQNPQAISYSYRLLGLSPQWQQTGDRTVTYPKLPPGKYRFELAAIVDGISQQEQKVHYDFRIHHPIWEKWWFILLALAALLYGTFLIWRYRERQLHKQELQEQEKIRFQFETLRSQVNPHFLFNSFNTLINLIDEEPKVAIQYAEKLSDLFRNMLAFRDKNSISLEEELKILNDYFFLQKKRYGDNLNLEITIDASLEKHQIIPLSLQMLVENAVKHNVISRSKPLYISIKNEGTYLVIQNQIQAKRSKAPSTQLGLQNIRRRYALLTELPVEVSSDESFFVVKIPLLSS